MKLDATNVLVFGAILVLVAVASWQLVGSVLVWAVWQVFLFYVLLVTIAGLLYVGLHVAVGRDE